MYNKFFSRYFIVVFSLLLSANHVSHSQQAFNVQDSLALRKLWMSLDGPNWKYPDGVQEYQKWFNTASRFSTGSWIGAYPRSGELSAIELQSFMIPANGNMRYRNMKDFINLETVAIRNIRQVHQFQVDSIITYLGANLRSLYFEDNQAIGKLPAKFFQNMPKLEFLSLRGNQLTDSIPSKAIGAASQLVHLDLSHNAFTGDVHVALLGLGAASINGETRNIELNHNNFKAIVGSLPTTLGYYNLYLYLHNNQISEDNGFVQALYAAPFSTVSFNISYNKLVNSKIVSFYPLYGNYYQDYMRYYTVLPQYLGSATIIDLKDLSSTVTALTDIKDDGYGTSIGYLVNDTIRNNIGITYQVHNGNASIVLAAGFFANNAHMVDGKCTIRPYLFREPVWDPSVYIPWYMVEFAPIIVRSYAASRFILTGTDPLVCKPQQIGGNRFKYKLEALGVDLTDIGSISLVKTSVSAGIPKDSSFVINLATVPDLLKSKVVTGELGYKGESCTLKIVSVTLRDRNSLLKTCDFQNVLNTTRIVMVPSTAVQLGIPDYYCLSGSEYAVKIVKPEAGVHYSIRNFSMLDQVVDQDTLYLKFNDEFIPNGTTLEVMVMADIDGGCGVQLAAKTAQVIGYEAPGFSIVGATPPTCSSDAVLSLKGTHPDYLYTPHVSSSRLTQLKKAGTASGDLEFKLSIYDLNEGYNSVYIEANHKVCYAYRLTYLDDGYALSFTSPRKTAAMDSIALIRFVERTGYKPTSTQNLLWYGRGIASGLDAAQKPIYMPIRDWYIWYGEGSSTFIGTKCGRITDLDFYNDGEFTSAMGIDKPFKLAFDSLPELRYLDISGNEFIGTFDSPKILTSSRLKRLTLSYNNFEDPSFVKIENGIKQAIVHANDNRLTFTSLLKVNNDYRSELMPQKAIFKDTLISVYEGKPLSIKNPVPATVDGLMHYYWHREYDTTTLSRERDLYIEKVPRDLSGNIVCEMQHEEIQSMSESVPNARLNPYSFPALYLQGMNITVTECEYVSMYAGNDHSVCSADSVRLWGSYDGNTSNPPVLWTAGTGTFNASKGNNSLETAYKPSAADIATGFVDFILKVTTQDGNCEFKDTMRVTLPVTPATPAAIAVPAKCSADTAHTILNKTTTPKGQYIWYNQPVGGTAAANPFDAGNVKATTTYYLVDSVSATHCASKRTAVTVIVNTTPATPTLPVAPTICYGAKAVLSKTPTPAKYFWYADSAGGKANANPFTTPALTKNTSYYLVDSSTTTKCASARVKLNVTVRAMVPKPDSVALPAVCEGGSVTLRTNDVATGQFFWYASETGGISKKQGDPSGALFTNASFYVIDSILSTKCTSARRKVDLTVHPRPDTPSAPIITACKGGSTTLLATETSEGSFYWYTAAIGGKPLANGTDITGVVADTKYYLSDSNLVSKCASVRKEVLVTVKEPELPTVSISVGDEDICKNETAKFEAFPIHGGLKPKYTWRVNETVVGADTNTFSSNTLGTGDRVSVTMISNESCISTPAVNSNIITMNVVASVIPEVKLREFEGQLCEGTEVLFEALAVHGGEKPSYVWKMNGATIGGDTPVFKTSTLKSGDVVSVELTSSASCASNPKAVSNDIDVEISPLVTPTVTISTSSLEICPEQQVYFGYNAVHQGLLPSLQWRVNNEVVSTNAEFSSSTLQDGDVVSLRLRSTGSCLLDSIALSNNLVFKVNLPTHISEVTSPSRVCDGESAQVVVKAEGTDLRYFWYENESDFEDSTLFRGFDKDTLTLINADTAINDNGYFVQVVGKCGTASSQAVFFTVLQSPSIISQPLATTTCASGIVPFEVQATGGAPLQYQWFEDGKLLSNGGVYEGVNTPRLVISYPDVAFDGRKYTVKVNNECSAAATSIPASLTVTDVVNIALAIQVADSTLCVGDTARFAATAFNAGINPQLSWRINGVDANMHTMHVALSGLGNGDKVDCMLAVSDACVAIGEVLSNTITMKVDSVVPEIVEVAIGNRCDTGSVVLGALASKGEIHWYTVSDTLKSIAIGTSFTTPKLTRTTHYYVKAFGESCVSVKSLVTAHVEKKPVVDAGADQIVCRSIEFIPLEQVSISGPLAWDIVEGNGDLQVVEAIPSGYYLSLYDKMMDKVVFRKYSQTEVCPSESDTVTYTFGIPQSVDAGTEPMLYADSTVMAGIIQNNFPSNTTYDVNQTKTWLGVKTACGAITELNLSQKGLSGTLAGVEQLYELQVLDLSHNALDSINTELYFISSKIQKLDLSHNKISYTRPLYLSYADLDTLNLSYNRFTDTIQFLNFSPKYVNLSHTQIQGVKFLYMLNQVPMFDFATQHLDIGNNGLLQHQIEGISLLDSLRYLDASHNLFDGNMADMSLLNAQLEHLDLSDNQIGAALVLSPKLSALKYVDLSHNKLSVIDDQASLPTFKSLQYLDLGNNWFANTAFDQNMSALSELQYFAIDSNALAHTEAASGFVSLPLLPANPGLILSVHHNHLHYDDLYPYKSVFANEGSRYVPQYDTIDQAYSLKPALGVMVRLGTTLGGVQTKYQWKKLGSSTVLSNTREYAFNFGAADAGNYFVEISNSDFPGLNYVRRKITLSKCDVGYIANVQVLNALACSKADTLMAKLTYGDLSFPQYLAYQWHFEGLTVEDAFKPKLTAYTSGDYYFSAYDSSNLCLINSNVVAVNNVDRNDPVLQLNVKDSTIINTKEYANVPNFQWFINGLPIAGANGPSLRVYYNGVYQLSAQSSGDCVYSSKYLEIKDFPQTFVRTEHVVNQKGQVVLYTGSHIEVYPNPAIDQFAIKNLMVGAEVQLVNLQGEVMVAHVADQPSMEIKTADLSKGVYLLNIKYQNSNTWEKIVIQ